MEELKLTKADAKLLYGNSNSATKKFLEDKFGKETFAPSPMDTIKTWPDACKATGEHPVKSLPYPKPVNDEQEAINAFAMLNIIRRALNGAWEPDWNNINQVKYWPYFYIYPNKASGSRLSYHDFGSGFSASSVGSRLCFPTKELAQYAGKTFSTVYEKMFVINKPKTKTKK